MKKLMFALVMVVPSLSFGMVNVNVADCTELILSDKKIEKNYKASVEILDKDRDTQFLLKGKDLTKFPLYGETSGITLQRSGNSQFYGHSARVFRPLLKKDEIRNQESVQRELTIRGSDHFAQLSVVTIKTSANGDVKQYLHRWSCKF
jgi:hypothetical protein